MNTIQQIFGWLCIISLLICSIGYSTYNCIQKISKNEKKLKNDYIIMEDSEINI